MRNLYASRWIGYGYDLLASIVWLPSKDKLYNALVSHLNIQPNETVLELGCGTGFLTKKLAAKNAIVTSVLFAISQSQKRDYENAFSETYRVVGKQTHARSS